jgi:hypothetical protein
MQYCGLFEFHNQLNGHQQLISWRVAKGYVLIVVYWEAIMPPPTPVSGLLWRFIGLRAPNPGRLSVDRSTFNGFLHFDTWPTDLSLIEPLVGRRSLHGYRDWMWPESILTSDYQWLLGWVDRWAAWRPNQLLILETLLWLIQCSYRWTLCDT